MTRVLGVDLSLRATGICLPDGNTELLHPTETGMARANWIISHISRRANNADVVVLEDALTHMPGAQEIAAVHYTVRLRLWNTKKPVALISPAALKQYATGRGGAKKPDMRMELYKRTGLDLEDDNEVDAWWLRAAGLEHYDTPIVELPQQHVQALKKVAWPSLAHQ